MSVRRTTPPEQIPVSLTGLTRWQVGDRILRLLTRGGVRRMTSATARMGQGTGARQGNSAPRFWARSAGRLPPSHRLVQRLRHRTAPAGDINLTLPDGVRVIGTVPDVYNDTIVRSTFSRAKAHATTSGCGPRSLRWPPRNRIGSGSPALVSHNADMRLRAPASTGALRILAELVDITERG